MEERTSGSPACALKAVARPSGSRRSSAFDFSAAGNSSRMRRAIFVVYLTVVIGGLLFFIAVGALSGGG
jgi:hypothetical protein